MNMWYTHSILFFFFNDTATTEIYTLSLHDALPILQAGAHRVDAVQGPQQSGKLGCRVIDLLLHLTIPRHEHQVLRRDEDESRGPHLHGRRVLTALQFDLAAERAVRAGGAIHRL